MKIIDMFRGINQRFYGVTIAHFLVNLFMSLFYIVLMAWSVAFLFNSFAHPLPWSVPKGSDEIYNDRYFRHELLQSGENID